MATRDAITTGAVIRITRKMAQLAPFVFRHAAAFVREGGLARYERTTVELLVPDVETRREQPLADASR